MYCVLFAINERIVYNKKVFHIDITNNLLTLFSLVLKYSKLQKILCTHQVE